MSTPTDASPAIIELLREGEKALLGIDFLLRHKLSKTNLRREAALELKRGPEQVSAAVVTFERAIRISAVLDRGVTSNQTLHARRCEIDLGDTDSRMGRTTELQSIAVSGAGT